MNVDLSLHPTLNRFCSTVVVIECREPITHSSYYLSNFCPALFVSVVSCCYFPTLLLGILLKVALNWNLQKGFLVLVGIRSVEQVKTTLIVIKYLAIAWLRHLLSLLHTCNTYLHCIIYFFVKTSWRPLPFCLTFLGLGHNYWSSPITSYPESNILSFSRYSLLFSWLLWRF